MKNKFRNLNDVDLASAFGVTPKKKEKVVQAAPVVGLKPKKNTTAKLQEEFDVMQTLVFLCDRTY